MENIHQIAQKMMTRGKGILAADESNPTADKRLDSVGVKGSPEMRRKYRDLFLSTPNLEHYISGVILYDETMRQNTVSGKNFVQQLEEIGVVPGLKVDTNLPTRGAITENAIRLARYAKLVQKEGMVPIIEPEVLLQGPHSIQTAERVTKETLQIVFERIIEEGVDLKGLILKTSMVVPGNESGEEMIPEIVAEKTVKVLRESVPEDLGGIVFLSGGQSPEEARDNLNSIAKLEPLPWEIAFSYARAIQGPALKIWQGKDENVGEARNEFLKWLVFDTKADRGELDEELEF
jgi:fructose-bisphosphate aldolase class I